MTKTFFGRLFHWGPLTALTIIKWITLATIYCNTMWYPPSESLGGLTYMTIFLVFSGMTMYHFFCAMFDGPGYLPLNWKPEQDKHMSEEEVFAQLQFCGSCNGFKAPRTHHCRKCGRCVMKMDHHCPWINNCVGHFNHGHFTAFLASAVCGCILSCITLSFSLYYGLNRSWYQFYGTGHEPQIVLTLWSLLATLLGLGLSIGVVIAVGLLLFFQFRSILRNQTGIEDWILEKAVYRYRHSEDTFVYPYDLGRWRNLRQVFYSGCAPKSDGVTWDIVDNSDQYSLTREQLCQKAEKRERAREYEIIQRYTGAWFPVMQGLSVCCRPPCTDEPRIPLTIGDRVRVTRWKKYWLYGDQVLPPGQQVRVRGWFPRRCAVEATYHTATCQQQHGNSCNSTGSNSSKHSNSTSNSSSSRQQHREAKKRK